MGNIEPVSAVAFYGLLVLAVIITGVLTLLCFMMRRDRDRRAADCAACKRSLRLTEGEKQAIQVRLDSERACLWRVMRSVRSAIQRDIDQSKAPSKDHTTLLAILWSHGVYDESNLHVSPVFASVMVDHRRILDYDQFRPWERIMVVLSREETPDWKDIVPFSH